MTIGIWEICFKVCFLEYQFSSNDLSEESMIVEIDGSLFNEEQVIDWQKLETKTQQIIQTIFENFPEI